MRNITIVQDTHIFKDMLKDSSPISLVLPLDWMLFIATIILLIVKNK